jgi:Ca2+-binding RTX toxin-like protein
VHGGEGDDILIGNDSDTLAGDEGNDTYHMGYGSYYIVDDQNYNWNTSINSFVVHAPGVSYENTRFYRVGDDFQVVLSDSNFNALTAVTIANFAQRRWAEGLFVYSGETSQSPYMGGFNLVTAWTIINSVSEDPNLSAAIESRFSAMPGDSATGVGQPRPKVTEWDDDIGGGAWDDTIMALGGNDTVHGYGGNDSLDGGIGDDHLYGMDGNDYLDGGSGNDYLEGGEGSDTIVGGAGDDLIASNSNDSVSAGDGNDTITAVGLAAGSTFNGEAGTDKLVMDLDLSGDSSGSLQYYAIVNAYSSYYSYATSSFATVNAMMTGAGNYLLYYLGSAGGTSAYGIEQYQVSLTGTQLDDLLIEQGGSRYDGSGGTDAFFANWSTDTTGINWTNTGAAFTHGGATIKNVERLLLSLGSGNDVVNNSAMNTNDEIYAGDGNNTITGGEGYDTIATGAGSDKITVSGGSDSVSAGDGNDTITAVGLAAGSSFSGEAGTDKLVMDLDLSGDSSGSLQYFAIVNAYSTYSSYSTSSFATVNAMMTGAGNYLAYYLGSAGSTSAYGIEQYQVSLTGTQLDDLLIEQGGSRYDGSGGTDAFFANWSTDTTGINWTNTGAAFTHGGATIKNVERLLLSLGSGNDVVNNSAMNTNDEIYAGDGNNTITGGEGYDTIATGAGSDKITVSGGSDSVSAGDGNDTITAVGLAAGSTFNGEAGTDKLVMDLDLSGDSSGSLQYYAIVNAYSSYYSHSTSSFATVNAMMTGAGNYLLYYLGSAGGTSAYGIEQYQVSLTGTQLDDLLIEQGGSRYDGSGGTDAFFANWSTDTTGINWTNTGAAFTHGGATIKNVERLLLSLGSGNDVVNNSAMNTNDEIYAGDGNNTITGGEGYDTIATGAGSDKITVSGGSDSVSAGDGNDTITAVGLAAGSTFNGEAGTDKLVMDLDLSGDSSGSLQYYAIVNAYSSYYSHSTSSFATVNAMMTGAGNYLLYYLGSAGGTSAYGIEQYQVSLTGTQLDDLLIEQGGSRYDGSGGTDAFFANWSTDTTGINWTNTGAAFTHGGATIKNVERLLLSLGSGNDVVNNSAMNTNDEIYAGDGNNTITGGEGYDTIATGAGSDKITVSGGSDSVSAGDGNDTITAVGLAAGSTFNGEAGTDKLVMDLDLSGDSSGSLQYYAIVNAYSSYYSHSTSSFATVNAMMTGAGNHLLYYLGSAGGTSAYGIEQYQVSLTGTQLDDLLIEQGGSRYDGSGGTDAFFANWSTDTTGINWTNTGAAFTHGGATIKNVERLLLSLGSGNDVVNNSAMNTNDEIYAGAGDDILNGGGGIDYLVGGLGNDTYIVDDLNDTLLEYNAEGSDTVISSTSYTLGENLESLILTGTAALTATGNALNNFLTGNSGANLLIGGQGNDNLDGGTGADTLQGGQDNDTYTVDNITDEIVEHADEGADTVRSSLNWTLGDNLENLTLIGSTAINAIGNGLNNILTGNANNNVLVGNGGLDNLIGRQGNDIYIISQPGALITERINEGVDTVLSEVNFILSVNVENLTLTGAANINGVGNTLDNQVYGNEGANNLSGGEGADILRGYGGNDLLDGGLGADKLAGGLGDDTYVVDDAGDTVTENVGEGTDMVRSALNYTLGKGLENLTLTGASNLNGTGNTQDNVITGNNGVNTLIGGAGNDTLDGGTGADVLLGGAGNDIYVVDTLSDSISENANEGMDTVRAAMTWTLGVNFENLVLTGTTAINGTGNSGSNTLTGNSAANVLDGGNGADTLLGGAGNDVYILDSMGDTVTELAGQGIDTVQAAFSYTLSEDLENLTLTGTASINATGNSNKNLLIGNGANNVLDGGTGSDTLIGGLGNDTYIVDSKYDVVTELADEGTDTLITALSRTLVANVENLTLTGVSAVNGTGNTLANTLTGNSAANTLSGLDGNDTLIGLDGNDTLDGGLGADSLTGGLGNDTYLVNDAGDNVSENAGEGTDLVKSSVSWTLGANVENLTLTGNNSVSATGNSGNNVITGNAGSNTLYGNGGTDTLAGGAGNDTYIVDLATIALSEGLDQGTDTVQASISWTLGNNLENLTLTGGNALNGGGNALANTLSGNEAANVLSGGDGVDTLRGYGGNDTLDGGLGADKLAGGLGDDLYKVDDAGDLITENSNEGTDTVQSSVSLTLASGLENLVLTGTAALNGSGNSLANLLTGNSAANVLSGGSGADTLDGGAGADTLLGGLGNDTFVADNVGDVITENAGEGTDTVRTVLSWTLGANLENLTLTGGNAVNGTGNSLANILSGNSGGNVLNGGGGRDTLIGGLGNDTYVVDSSDDAVTEVAGEGTDTVQASLNWTLGANLENLTLTGTANLNGTGNTLDNTLSGNEGNNLLSGGDGVDTLRGYGGNDTLDGGLGADKLTGGLGDDLYYVDNSADTVTENAGEGTDTVHASLSWTLASGLENLVLTGAAAINGTGNSLANAITGNSGSQCPHGRHRQRHPERRPGQRHLCRGAGRWRGHRGGHRQHGGQHRCAELPERRGPRPGVVHACRE